MLTLPQFALLGMQPWMDAAGPSPAPVQQPEPTPAPVQSPPAPGPSPLTQALLAAQAQGAQQSVLTEDDKRQALFDGLGSMGMQLLAAGQYMTGAQRGQILANAAGSMDMQKRLLNAAQTRLMMQSYQDASTRNAQREALKGALLSKGGLSDSQAAFAAMDPEGFVKSQYEVENRKPMAEWRPAGDGYIVNSVTGEFKKLPNQYDELLGQNGPGTQVAGGPSDPSGVTDIPADPNAAFGRSGAMTRATSAIGDLWSGTSSEETGPNKDISVMRNLNNKVRATLATNWNGKPTNWTQQQTETAVPGQLFTGPSQARGYYESALGEIQQQKTETTIAFQDAARLGKREDMLKAKRRLEELKNLEVQVDAVVQNFGDPGSATRPGGLNPAGAPGPNAPTTADVHGLAKSILGN